MKFKAFIFPIKLGEAWGKWAHCEANDALDANSKFCLLCVKLGAHHKHQFDFTHLQKED